MERLEEYLSQLNDLIKALMNQPVKPSIKPPAIKPLEPVQPDLPDLDSQAPKLKAPSSVKDPKKIAEQIKDPSEKKEALKTAKNGQWSLK